MRMASRKTEFPRAVPSGDGESATTAPVQPGVVSPVYLGGATEGQRGVGEDVVVRGEIVKEVGLETKVVPVRARRSMEIDPAMDDELSMLAREIDSSLSRSTSCASMLFSEDEDFLERPRSRRKRRHSRSDEESSVVESDSQTSAKRKGKAGKAKAPSSAEQFRVALYEGGTPFRPRLFHLRPRADMQDCRRRGPTLPNMSIEKWRKRPQRPLPALRNQ
ncbi:uncharacterized protein LOC128201997 [Galleria mellonella]|uniref:Uncharacterized protein LOC128201997 n=1 Tax=Galleria mellonella TaxID=7137 RepID=A0ABM3MZD7_GALME|nr:uncharacterized protein LOC128201997 [Galleria mellonella]